MGYTAGVDVYTAQRRFIPTCVGYTLTATPWTELTCGSSPRAWGILLMQKTVEIYKRFIPTCVGYTHHQQRRLDQQGGSSPRAWGIRLRVLSVSFSFPVHPHVRGVYIVFFPHGTHFSGSSPRAWGIRVIINNPVQDFRFIPTCVGYTFSRAASSREMAGSSPRAWGIRNAAAAGSGSLPVHPHVRGVYIQTMLNDNWEKRFIPTCVGYTSHGPPPLRRMSVHPHVRGVYAVWNHGKGHNAGSSPRAWGILRHVSHDRLVVRFIPTCVGYTLKRHKKKSLFQPFFL